MKMDDETLERMISEREGSFSMDFPKLMRKVYLWMTLALVISGVTAYGLYCNPIEIPDFEIENPVIPWVIFFIVLAVIFGPFLRPSRFIHRLSLTTATLLFVFIAVTFGFLCSGIFNMYTMDSIAGLFFNTAGMFAVMSAIGYFTKKDLSSMGKFFLMAFAGIIIATVVNFYFMHSGLLVSIINYAVVPVFAGYAVFDTHEIKCMLVECDDMNEETQKIALLGSVSLYVDFICLFIYILRFAKQ